MFLQKVEAKPLDEALKKCFTFREAETPESFSKTIKAINTKSFQMGWTAATVKVPRERDFKEAFNDVLTKMAKLEKSFKGVNLKLTNGQKSYLKNYSKKLQRKMNLWTLIL